MSLVQPKLAELRTKSDERDRLERRYRPLMHEEFDLGNLVSYTGNKTMPLLRLYRFKEAFAYGFVREFLHRFGLSERDYVFDPFAGMGTTPFTAMLHGIPSIAVDTLPVAVFIAQTIPKLLFIDPEALKLTFHELQERAGSSKPAEVAMDVPIMGKAFSESNLLRLRKWKTAIEDLSGPLKDTFLLLFFAVLEATSYTSKDGQFLRLNRDKHCLYPDAALSDKVSQAMSDIDTTRRLFPQWTQYQDFLPTIDLGDARKLASVSFKRPPTAIITSPPYVNRYDYTRTYSLELCFHFVRNFEQLRDIRLAMLRSHIESKTSAEDKAPHPAVKEVLDNLYSKRLNNPRIPYMLTAYFVDMQTAIKEWRRTLAPAARVAMVVDNVRFEGELVPVDLVLSEMAEEAGFSVEEIIICRYKGNSSQQMRAYGRVPVRESVVIWRRL